MLFEMCICIILTLVKFNQLSCTKMKFGLTNLLLTWQFKSDESSDSQFCY
jgi:hypothetical protein